MAPLKMAVGFKIALALVVLLSLKKTSLVTCNSICYSLYPEDVNDLKETYITVMYRAAKYAGRDLPGAFDSGGHVVTTIKVC